MALTVGSLSQVSVLSTTDVLAASAATGGTTPYSYQWYRSTATGFSPGAGNLISGATALGLNDSGLTPGTVYFYKVVAQDSAATPSVVSYTQLQVTTLAPSLSQNQFSEAPYIGQVDLSYNYNTKSMQFDAVLGTGTLVAGQAVKFSTTAGGIPKVVACTATSDVCVGFVNYNIKNPQFVPGDIVEVSQSGNVMYVYAALAVSRGNQLTSLPAGVAGGCNGGVVPAIGGSLPIVGYALDTAAIGQLFRINLTTPAFTLG